MLRCPKSSVHHAAAQRCSKSVLQHAPQLCSAARSRSQIRSAAPAAYPTPAEVSRTVLDLGNDGTLSTISSACGTPLGTPVSYSLDKQGQPHLHLELGSLELANLAKNPSCSLLVTPTSFPARAVASVALSGTIVETPAEDPSAPSTYCLKVEKAIYFGGLDQVRKTAALLSVHLSPTLLQQCVRCLSWEGCCSGLISLAWCYFGADQSRTLGFHLVPFSISWQHPTHRTFAGLVRAQINHVSAAEY